MKENCLAILHAEINGELESFTEVVTEWENFRTGIDESNLQSSDLRVIGSILHDSYTCIEKFFPKSHWKSMARFHLVVLGTAICLIECISRFPISAQVLSATT